MVSVLLEESMQKYYRENEIFIGLDEDSMPMFIPLNIFMSDIIEKKIKLKKNSQGVSLKVLFEQVHQANEHLKHKRSHKVKTVTIQTRPTEKDKKKASELMTAFESLLQAGNKQ